MGREDNAQIKTELAKIAATYHELQDRALKLLLDRQIRIISNYNGQPHGSSRPSQRGKIKTITSCDVNDRITLSVDGERVGLFLEEVEFIADES